MAEWTMDRLLLSPSKALAALNSLEERVTAHSRRVSDLLEANNRYIERARKADAGAKEWALIEALRADEGSSILICCDNPDFSGQPNAKVFVNAEWTGWDDREFTGDTVLDALSNAAFEKKVASCATLHIAGEKDA